MSERPGKLKRVEWVCWECLEEEPVRLIFTRRLWESFSYTVRKPRESESIWALFQDSIVKSTSKTVIGSIIITLHCKLNEPSEHLNQCKDTSTGYIYFFSSFLHIFVYN